MSNGFKKPDRIKNIKAKKATTSKSSFKWILLITIISFFLSIIILFLSTAILEEASTFISFVVLFVIIFVGVFFDIIGVAVTAADESPFHAMSAKKFYGAREAVNLIKNADKVASFCNDVIGDVCGVISGTAGALIVASLSDSISSTVLLGAVISAMIASLTIGGKAFGKTFGMKNSNYIVYRAGMFLALFRKSKR